MLIEFTVGNFRSFKEPVTLSMVAARLASQDPQVDVNNTFQVGDDLKLLTSAGVYGANASGKSNLVKALLLMRNLVRNSSRESQADEPIRTEPFRLDAATAKQPSYFEVVFRYQNIPYRYGFEVTQERVISEWLFYSPHGKEAELFIREGDDIQPNRALKGARPLVTHKNTRSNALFLSVAAQFNVEIAKEVSDWFRLIAGVSGLDDSGYGGFTIGKYQEDQAFRAEVLHLMNNSDVGIKNILVEKGKEGEEAVDIKSVHHGIDENGNAQDVVFSISDESEGTKKLFFLSRPILDALRKGRILVVDELEARMHTFLTRQLVSLFNSPITNPKHAQLIFATHDTNLLSKELFRRDQIWFVEKDEAGASHLYSLAELKVKNERIFENDYLQGRYGGVPVLGDMRGGVHAALEREALEDEAHAAQ